MKKLLVIICALGIMVPVTAQVVKQQQGKSARTTAAKTALTPATYAAAKVEQLESSITLTAEQKQKLTKMYEAAAPKRIGAIGTDAQTISEANQEEIKKRDMILTQEQKFQLQQQAEARRVQAQERAAQRGVERSANEVDQPRTPLKDALRK